MSKDTYESRIKSWKTKAVARNLELQKRNKRIKELLISRDLWKAKYQHLREEVGYGAITLRKAS